MIIAGFVSVVVGQLFYVFRRSFSYHLNETTSIFMGAWNQGREYTPTHFAIAGFLAVLLGLGMITFAFASGDLI